MKHTCSLTVRTYECDSYGHVNNAVYLQYLEYARMEFLKDAGFDYNAFRKAGLGLVVAKVCISYKAPAVFGDTLTIVTEPIRYRGPFGVFKQDIFREQTLIAEAEVSWFSVNTEGKPTPLPKEFSFEGLYPSSPLAKPKKL
ncbi:MAG: thioesterase family protein [Spirochaetales bacterium]